MAKTKSYIVTYFRAFRTVWGAAQYEGIVIPNMIGGDHKREQVDAASIPELLAAIESRANELGYGTSVGVHLARGERKPNGFDAATHSLTYNLVLEPK